MTKERKSGKKNEWLFSFGEHLKLGTNQNNRVMVEPDDGDGMVTILISTWQ